MGSMEGRPDSGLGSSHERHDPSNDARHVRGIDGRSDAAAPASGGSEVVEHGDAGLAEHGPLPGQGNELRIPGPGQEPLPGFVAASTANKYMEVAAGPTPPPTMLQMYRDVDPSLPDRIMTMAERDQEN